VTEGKIEGGWKRWVRRGRRRKKILNYRKVDKVYCNRTLWRTRFGRGHETEVRVHYRVSEWVNVRMNERITEVYMHNV